VILASLQNWGGPTYLVQLTKESVNLGCTRAKNLALAGAKKEFYNELHLDINPNFNLTGAQLAGLTQALTYKGIYETKAPWDRQLMTQMLAITRHAVNNITGRHPDDSKVWKAT
jgi:hypothetical protein